MRYIFLIIALLLILAVSSCKQKHYITNGQYTYVENTSEVYVTNVEETKNPNQ